MDKIKPTFSRRISEFVQGKGKECACAVFGLGLLLFATGLLFWNEKRAVQTAGSLEEGLQDVVTIANTDVISVENNGKLVHLTGDLETDKVLRDTDFNVSIYAVKLKRVVEIYQWVEHDSVRALEMVQWKDYEPERGKDNGKSRKQKGDEYFYNRECMSNESVDDRYFDRYGDVSYYSSMPPVAKSYVAKKVHIGKYILSEGLKRRIHGFKQLRLDNHNIPNAHFKLFDGMAYSSANPTSPQIGDIRIKFLCAGISRRTSYWSPMVVSIIARQSDNTTLVPYETVTGNVIELLSTGSLSAKMMFGEEKMKNSLITCLLRLGGCFTILIGLCALTNHLTTLVDWVPFIQSIVPVRVWSMTTTLSISLSLTITVIGWIVYRPLLGNCVLLFSLSPLIVYKLRAMTSWRRTNS